MPIETSEKRKLLGKIESIIKEKALKELDIQATPEEARLQFEKMYPGMKENPSRVLETEQLFLRNLSLALKEICGKLWAFLGAVSMKS